MTLCITGSDEGIFVFGRKALKTLQTASIQFVLHSKPTHIETDFWENGLCEIAQKTRFGRIGILFDRHNTAALHFTESIDLKSIAYTQSSQRSESQIDIKTYPIQVLKHMVQEGFGNTVEFRRIARKYIRECKKHHRDSLFFLDSVFGEERIRNTLQHIAGKQIQLYFPSDFYTPVLESRTERVLQFHIKNETPQEFIQKRAEQILKTQTRDSDFIKQA